MNIKQGDPIRVTLTDNNMIVGVLEEEVEFGLSILIYDDFDRVVGRTIVMWDTVKLIFQPIKQDQQ